MDRREGICVRLLEIVAATPGVAKAYRNNDTVSGKVGTTVIVWDGDESASEDDPRSRPKNAPRRVTMTPNIEVMVEAPSDAVGSQMNVLRLALIKAIASDEALATLVGVSGYLRYEGCTTEMARGRTMTGTMGLNFAFEYTLIQAEL